MTSTCIDSVVELEAELLRGSPRPPRAASALRTLKQIVCSDDACEIRMTLTLFDASVAEQPAGDARHADHARAAQRQQREIADRR